MSQQKELEKLQAMRAELEAESCSLIEEQQKLENNVQSLEEQIVVEELKKEKAVIEDLKKRNKMAKEAITQLEDKKKALESKLNQEKKAPKAPKKVEEAPAQPKETVESKPAEPAPEASEEAGVTITAIECEAFVEDQEIIEETPKQEKKKRRFF